MLIPCQAPAIVGMNDASSWGRAKRSFEPLHDMTYVCEAYGVPHIMAVAFASVGRIAMKAAGRVWMSSSARGHAADWRGRAAMCVSQENTA